MRKKLSKRQRILIITACVLALSVINIVWHEVSITKQTKPVIHLQAVRRPARPVTELAGTLKWFWKKHDQHTQKNKPYKGFQNFTATLILTYMRSGSSVTGEVLQQHPDSFYVFEPLHMLEASFRANFPVQFLNGTYIRHGNYTWEQIAVPTLQAWFNCDIENVFIKGLYDQLFLSFGKKTTLFHQCIEAKNPNNTWDLYTSTINFCVRKLRESCLASKYRVIKTIRIGMYLVKSIMTEVPQLKVIHLVRNPHDTLMSQKAVMACGNATLEELANCTSFHCSRLSNDILAKEELPVLENRVLTVFFENVALNPMKVSDEMYKFVGINLTDSVRNAIYNLTAEKSKDKCVICQQSWHQVGNVTLTGKALIEKWRGKMSKPFGVMVDMMCKESITYLNYSMYGNTYPLLRRYP